MKKPTVGWMLSNYLKPLPFNSVGGRLLSVDTVLLCSGVQGRWERRRGTRASGWRRAGVEQGSGLGKRTASTGTAPRRMCTSSLPGNFLNPNLVFSPPRSPAPPDTRVHPSVWD